MNLLPIIKIYLEDDNIEATDGLPSEKQDENDDSGLPTGVIVDSNADFASETSKSNKVELVTDLPNTPATATIGVSPFQPKSVISANSVQLLPFNTKSFAVSRDHLCNIQSNEDKQAITDCGGIRGLCQMLNTDPHSGLLSNSEKDLQLRLEAFGDNVFPVKKPKKFWRYSVSYKQ